MRRLLALPATALLLGAAAPAPQRIVSLNLCADQYLMALADPAQIAALTALSRDPQMSAGAKAATRLPVTAGGAEEVLTLRPDLLIAAPGWRPETTARLRERGITIIELPAANTYADIVRQVRQIARLTGHPARGEALVRRMDDALARLPRAGRGRSAAYYQRRGYLTGTGTLVDDLMRRVGLVNLAERIGTSPLARVPLEQLALARPDFLIVETATDTVQDRGTEMLHHPVVARIPRLRLPEAWTVCGGPAYVLAAQSLTRQLGGGEHTAIPPR